MRTHACQSCSKDPQYPGYDQAIWVIQQHLPLEFEDQHSRHSSWLPLFTQIPNVLGWLMSWARGVTVYLRHRLSLPFKLVSHAPFVVFCFKARSELLTVQQASAVKNYHAPVPTLAPSSSPQQLGSMLKAFGAELRSVCQWIPCSLLYSRPNISLQKLTFSSVQGKKMTSGTKLVTYS